VIKLPDWWAETWSAGRRSVPPSLMGPRVIVLQGPEAGAVRLLRSGCYRKPEQQRGRLAGEMLSSVPLEHPRAARRRRWGRAASRRRWTRTTPTPPTPRPRSCPAATRGLRCGSSEARRPYPSRPSATVAGVGDAAGRGRSGLSTRFRPNARHSGCGWNGRTDATRPALRRLCYARPGCTVRL